MKQSKKNAIEHLLIIPAVLAVVTFVIMAIVFPLIEAFIPQNQDLIVNKAMASESAQMDNGGQNEQ